MLIVDRQRSKIARLCAEIPGEVVDLVIIAAACGEAQAVADAEHLRGNFPCLQLEAVTSEPTAPLLAIARWLSGFWK